MAGRRATLWHPLGRLEAGIFSDRRLLRKQTGLWLLLLLMIGYCGLGSEWHFPPGQLVYLQDPARFDGAPLHIFYTPIVRYPEGDGQLFKSWFGWVPLRTPLTLERDGEVHSIAGTWHADGSLNVQRDLAHPDRSLKTLYSGVAALALTGALLVRYGRPGSRASSGGGGTPPGEGGQAGEGA